MVVLISFTSIRKNICNYCWLVAGIEVMLIYTFLSFVIQLLFLSFEMMLLLMCFSVSTWGTKLYKIRSSFYLFVFTVFGGIFWVICTVTLSLITGSNNYILDFSVNLNQQISFALMFTVALGIKVPVFPFHLWLPEVHSETDTCGSVLLAGVLLKVGSYGLMRFTLTLFPVGYSYWSCFIFVVSLFGSYLGSINCLTIYDIKQIIAYSSITHMNLAVADLFTLNIYGLQGSLVTSLAHGLSSSGLFCSVGLNIMSYLRLTTSIHNKGFDLLYRSWFPGIKFTIDGLLKGKSPLNSTVWNDIVISGVVIAFVLGAVYPRRLSVKVPPRYN